MIRKDNRVSSLRPCRHCGKPDWCLVLDNGLEVCARGLIADGWEGTGKVTAEGHEYLRPKPEPKAARPVGQTFIHVYETADGGVFHLKREYRSDGKRIAWVKPLGNVRESDLLPYRWQEVQAALTESRPIFFVEGEKCADDLWAIGIPATTIRGKTLSGENAQRFKGAIVILAPDRDQPGVAFAAKLLDSLKDLCTIKLALLPPSDYWWKHLSRSDGLDVSDFLAYGGTKEQVLEAISEDLSILGNMIQPEKALDVDKTVTLEQTLHQLQFIFDLEDEARQMWELGQLAHTTKRSVSALLQLWQSHQDARLKFAPIDLHELMARQELERRWLIAGYVPAGTVIGLIAAGGTGKTLLAYDLVKAIAMGTPWNGFPTQQTKVLVIQTDEQFTDTVDRLEIAGFHESIASGQVAFVEHWQFSQVAKLRKYVSEEGIGLCVIDSFTSANRRSVAEEKDAAYAKSIYDLRDLASETGCTFIVLHHTNKGGGSRGTTAFEDNVSEVWFLNKPASTSDGLTRNHRILEIKKSRSGCSGQFKILLNVDDYSWEHQGDIDNFEEGKPIGARLLEFLQAHPGTMFEPEELLFERSLSDCKTRDAMRKQLERLRKKGLIEGEDRVKSHDTGAVRYKVYYYSERIKESYTLEPVENFENLYPPIFESLDVQRGRTLSETTSYTLDILNSVQSDVQRTEPFQREHPTTLDMTTVLDTDPSFSTGNVDITNTYISAIRAGVKVYIDKREELLAQRPGFPQNDLIGVYRVIAIEGTNAICVRKHRQFTFPIDFLTVTTYDPDDL